MDRLVRGALTHARARGARTGAGPRGVVDPGGILDEMRLRKDAGEVEALRRAAALSMDGHRALARELRPGAGEWELQAAIEAVFRRHGGSPPAYPSIVASGANACVLHYADNQRRARAGELVLVDAAAELGHYCADVTRTYPVDGRFTPEQRAVHDIVNDARAAAIAAAAPDVPVGSVHRAACAVLADGLASLGVLAKGEGEAEGSGARCAATSRTRPRTGWDSTRTTWGTTRSTADPGGSRRGWCSPSSRASTSGGTPRGPPPASPESAFASKTMCWSPLRAWRTSPRTCPTEAGAVEALVGGR